MSVSSSPASGVLSGGYHVMRVISKGADGGWVENRRDTPNGVLRVICRHDSPWAEPMVEDLAFGRIPEKRLFSSSRGAHVYFLPSEGSVRPGVFLKRCLVRGERLDWLKHVLRSSRAMRSLAAGLRMEQLGLRAPRTICAADLKAGFGVGESYILTAEVEASSFDALLARVPDGPQRMALIARAAAEMARLHNARVFHGDPCGSNLLLPDHGGPGVWIDNERNRFPAKLPDRAIVHNLVRMNTPRTYSIRDRLYFFKVYAGTRALSLADRKALRKRVFAATRRRWKERGWLAR